MSLSTGDNDVDRKLHESRLATLDEAKAKEKEARRLRHEGRDQEAIAAYDRAGDLYMDSNLAFQYLDAELADEVRNAIARCQKIIHNIRHPKAQRPPATMPRPDCLHCGKPLRRYKWDDDPSRQWGDYGDNNFCGLRCGWRWACNHAPMPKSKKP